MLYIREKRKDGISTSGYFSFSISTFSYLSTTLLDLRQHIPELRVIHLHAIIQINGDHLVGEVVNLFLVGAQLIGLRGDLRELLLQLHALGGRGGGDALFEVGDGSAVAALLLVDVVSADTLCSSPEWLRNSVCSDRGFLIRCP